MLSALRPKGRGRRGERVRGGVRVEGGEVDVKVEEG